MIRLLVDIGHPGHVHLFKNAIKQLRNKGHEVCITVKDIPAAKQLLMAEGLSYIDLGKKSDSLSGKFFNQIKYNLRVLRIVRKNKIRIGFGTSLTIPHVSLFSRMRAIVMDDDDDIVQPLFVNYGHPYSDAILTPDPIKRRSSKSIYYPGTHELAYLHPNYFEPNSNVLNEIGLKQGEVFFIMRFVAFKGHHDGGHSGISLDQKLQLTKILESYGKVFITSERELEPELEKYRVPVSPEKIHSLMYYAHMFIGDSQTMISEAAILGTPAIKFNTFAGELSVPNELENKYELCYAFKPIDFDKMLIRIKSLLNENKLKENWYIRKEKFYKDKIDVTAFFVWFVENYPESRKILLKDQNYFKNFK